MRWDGVFVMKMVKETHYTTVRFRVSGLVNAPSWCWEGARPEEGMEVLCPTPIPCPIHLFYWWFSYIIYYILYNKLADVSLCSVSCDRNLWNLRSGSWNSWFVSNIIRNTRNNLGLAIGFSSRDSLVESGSLVGAVSVRIELNCKGCC